MRLRRFLRFCMFSFVIAIAVIAVSISHIVSNVQRQRAVLDYVEANKGKVLFDYQKNSNELQVEAERAFQRGAIPPANRTKPVAPSWAIGLLGEEYFRTITELSLGNEFNPAEIDRATLAEICALPNLRRLGIASQGVTDDEIEILSRCGFLEQLSLDQCDIGDSQLYRLASCKKLKFASFNCTKVTSEGVDALKRLLPGCRVSLTNITTETANNHEMHRSSGGLSTLNKYLTPGTR